MDRRRFLGTLAAGVAAAALGRARGDEPRRPNVVFVFGDQWRAQATGYAGDPNARTPNLDRLASESVNFTHAVSGCPVCTPYRASLLTGQYWLTHGCFVNDVHLRDDAVSVAEAFAGAGYDTAYIGKWHVDGRGRSSFTPPERRQGFQFWRALECTHDYNHSAYYADDPEKRFWDGYDAAAQTQEALNYIRSRSSDKPFALFLSWGPPHDPYKTAPEEFRRLFDPQKVVLRPNVPADRAEKAREELADYYAHIAALDVCLGRLVEAVDDDTVFVFTSDHGDMLHSQGSEKKQQPFDESIRVPFLLRCPARLRARTVDTLLNTPDIMPTLLGLCGAPIPGTVEGRDFSKELLRGDAPEVDAALLMCPAPFGQWTRTRGGREYRGIRTGRYTYTRSLDGPWLLYDNEEDPCQLENLCNRAEAADVQAELEGILKRKLEERHDEFRPAAYYLERWGYAVDETGTVPYTY